MCGDIHTFGSGENSLLICSCFLSFIAEIQKLRCTYSRVCQGEVLPAVKACLIHWTRTSPWDFMGCIQGCRESWLMSICEATLNHLWSVMAIRGGFWWLGEKKVKYHTHIQKTQRRPGVLQTSESNFSPRESMEQILLKAISRVTKNKVMMRNS